jgi:hypothetical protein
MRKVDLPIRELGLIAPTHFMFASDAGQPLS